MPITVFSRSVSGYNRHEVDEYIASMNRAFLKTRREYEKKIEILEAEAAKLRAELEACRQAEEARAHVDVPPAPPEAEPVPETEPEKVEEPAPEDDGIAEKSRRYDEISQKVGEILMNANAEASIIVREADEKVKATLSGTMSTLRTELTSVISKLTALLEEAEAGLSLDGAQNGEDA